MMTQRFSNTVQLSTTIIMLNFESIKRNTNYRLKTVKDGGNPRLKDTAENKFYFLNKESTNSALLKT